MRVGDIVQWGSQSHGYYRLKGGRVVAVVPARKLPEHYIPAGCRSGSTSGFGTSRGHESYLIQVGNSRRLYWPRVQHLQLVKHAGTP